tara:strand:- start:37736 stop:38995 length:1260 start_codon:yes stop_codon:yes gene_type:complete
MNQEITNFQNKFIFNLLIGSANKEDFFLASQDNSQDSIIKKIEINYLHKFFLDFMYKNKLTDYLNEDSLKKLKKEAILLSVRNLKLHEIARKISHEFELNNIRYSILKGLSISRIIYEDASFRTLRDLDVLVHVNDLDSAVLLLKKFGFYFPGRPVGNFKIFHSEDNYDLPKLIDSNGLIIEVHFSILGDYKNECFLTKEILRNENNFTIDEKNINAPSLEENFAHLLYHGTSKEILGSGLVFISDLYKILESKNFDITKAIKIIKNNSLEHELRFYLDILNYFNAHNLKSKILEEHIEAKSMDDYLLVDAIRLLFSQAGVSQKRLLKIKKFRNDKNLITKLEQIRSIFFPSTKKLSREFGETINRFNFFKIYIKYLKRSFRELGKHSINELKKIGKKQNDEFLVYTKVDNYFKNQDAN